MTKQTRQAFEAIGAVVEIETAGFIFDIGIQRVGEREVFRLRYPWSAPITAAAIDVKPRLQHLVLDVSAERLPIRARYLCGHDERHWFVASLPINEQSTTVRGAMEVLKPTIVRREQKQKGVKSRLHRRKTAAYIRQGEWFFLPRPTMHVGEFAVRGEQLVREGGKPHEVEWIYRPQGRDEIFVRGAVAHPDHETIHLQVWHRALQNVEVDRTPGTRPYTRVSYFD